MLIPVYKHAFHFCLPHLIIKVPDFLASHTAYLKVFLVLSCTDILFLKKNSPKARTLVNLYYFRSICQPFFVTIPTVKVASCFSKKPFRRKLCVYLSAIFDTIPTVKVASCFSTKPLRRKW